MDSEKKSLLQSFAVKAAQRLEDKKTVKKQRLYIPSLDEEITIRNLTKKELIECYNVDDRDDPDYSDVYAIYLAVIEPSLRDTATLLKENGQIVEYTDVCNIFEMHELNSIAKEIMKLSGVSGGRTVTIVEELKNS